MTRFLGLGTKTWAVSELMEYIRQLLEDDVVLHDVWLAGEVSNFSRSAPGHVYFTLKDAQAALGCVAWRTVAARLTWQPALGDAAVAHGSISIYGARGTVQLYIDQLLPAGQGDLYAQFERLRDRLRDEGLFDRERRSLPEFPRVLGIVTSPRAAALQDVLRTLERRYPLARVLLAPAMVQGEQAPLQIVAALRALDAREEVDAILLVRGGGSLEELWAFNDERVARAVVACRHPVVTGVGHETDFTIADFVSDLRAPTPTAAAELSAPDQAEIRQRIGAWQGQMEWRIGQRLVEAGQALQRQMHNLQLASPRARIDARRQQADEMILRAGRSLFHTLELWQAGLAGVEARLQVLSPLATLERGYAIVRREEDSAIVASVGQVSAGDGLRVRVGDGEFAAVAGPSLKETKVAQATHGGADDAGDRAIV
ncbi:MAG TPA: exodeoxyribonuclease VII large subunit [Anaerolineae bacterium]|nr:exodeoxyribonuclease VII large subunit [Anaerolineae bacterium]